MKRSRQDKTVAEKLELLNRYKALPSLSQREAAERLGISRGFLQNLLKNEAAICAKDQSLSAVKRKRVGKDEEVENALFAWFKFNHQRYSPVNGPILKHIANNIAQAAGHKDFKVTDGWFSRWKKRHGVKFSALKGEAVETEAGIGMVEEFCRTTMQDILNAYLPENNYSADETLRKQLIEDLGHDKEWNIDQDLNNDDDEPGESTPSAAEMRECLRRLALGLDQTAFQGMDMFIAVKTEIDDHLGKTFPP